VCTPQVHTKFVDRCTKNTHVHCVYVHCAQENKWRRAPHAHTKYGYAPIYMPDLHGVPLPFSQLDKKIESLFGPTVVRRKILTEGSQDLASVEGSRVQGLGSRVGRASGVRGLRGQGDRVRFQCSMECLQNLVWYTVQYPVVCSISQYAVRCSVRYTVLCVFRSAVISAVFIAASSILQDLAVLSAVSCAVPSI